MLKAGIEELENSKRWRCQEEQQLQLNGKFTESLRPVTHHGIKASRHGYWSLLVSKHANGI